MIIVKFYCSLLWFNKQSTELLESIRQVQEVAQHEIDDLMREKALNLQTIATLRKEIEALVSNQVSDWPHIIEMELIHNEGEPW